MRLTGSMSQTVWYSWTAPCRTRTNVPRTNRATDETGICCPPKSAAPVACRLREGLPLDPNRDRVTPAAGRRSDELRGNVPVLRDHRRLRHDPAGRKRERKRHVDGRLFRCIDPGGRSVDVDPGPGRIRIDNVPERDRGRVAGRRLLECDDGARQQRERSSEAFKRCPLTEVTVVPAAGAVARTIQAAMPPFSKNALTAYAR